MSYITIVTPQQAYCGKTFTYTDGEVEKSRGHVPARCVARTTPCRDLRQLQQIINGLSIGEAIILGYVPETIGVDSYSLLSTKLIKEHLEKDGQLDCTAESIIHINGHYVLARLKKHFKPSGFFCLDRDIDEDAPPDIRRIQQLPAAHYMRLICEETSEEIKAAFWGADYLRVTSSSGRVLLPDGSPYRTDIAEHIFFQAQDPDDIERFSLAFAAATIGNGFCYISESEGKLGGVVRRRKFIFDPSVFTLGRLFFESSPLVSGGLKLKAERSTLQPWDGNKVNTAAVREPTHSIHRQLEKLQIRYQGTHFEADGLSPALVVETKEYGMMSVSSYDAGDYGKLRCQSPFRESKSWAAYLNRHEDGSTYLWDEGTRTKYKLQPEDDTEELGTIAEMVNRFRKRELANRNMQQFALECDIATEPDDEVAELLERNLAEQRRDDSDDEPELPPEEKEPGGISDEEQTECLNKIEQPAPRFKALSIADMQSIPMPTAESLNLWGNRAFVAGGLTAVVGAPKVGKSSFLLYMMMCAACGKEWLGYRFNRELKVLWLQAELMLPFLLERINQAMEGFTEAQKEKIRANIYSTGQFNAALNSTDQFAYKQMIAQYNPDMVIIDPLRNLTNYKSENDNAEMIATLVALRDAAKEVNDQVCIVVAHHTRKLGAGDPKFDPLGDISIHFDKIAGAGSFRSMYDAGILIQQDPQQQSTKQVLIDIRNGQPMGVIEARRENEAWLTDSGLANKAKQFAGVDEVSTEKLVIEEVSLKLRKLAAIDYDRAVKLSQLKVELLEEIIHKHGRSISDRKFMNAVEGCHTLTMFKQLSDHNAIYIYLDDSE